MTRALAPLPPAVRDAGAQLFARYAYPPNVHGYCGPDAAAEVLAYASGAQAPDPGLRAHARSFQGAWPYLDLIADANGVADRLDPRVVRGYWLGEPAVGAVSTGALVDHLQRVVRPRLGRSWSAFVGLLGAEAVPDHAFHVLCVYPWMGLLREGAAEPARSVIESCCIRPGRIVGVEAEHATVVTPEFVWNGSRMQLGRPQIRRVRWRRDGLGTLGDDPAPGDAVTLHWDWICERVPDTRLRRLTATLAQRMITTRW